MIAWIKHLAQSIQLQFVWSLPDTRMSDEHLTKTWQLLALPAGLSDTSILPLFLILGSFQSFGF